MGLLKYVKAAFLNHWNLLAFLGGSAFALVSGRPDIWGALVVAAELAYLGFVGTHERFQKYVDIQERQAARGQQSEHAQRALARMMHALPKDALQRFETLRTRCRELRQIALDLQHPGGGAQRLDELQLAGLDRLLWIFLKLLFTEFSLRRFFEKTRGERIDEEIDRIERRLREEESRTPLRERVIDTLRDNLETSRQRLANLQKARENHELVQLEIGRLEAKIRSLSELAVNRHEPEFISGQVGQVAESMVETERTINELQFVTGLDGTSDVPELVPRETVSTTR
ncbi:MAG TPA: hypothetical protein VML55_03015 [Planctomycetaceae bacterium]|nr:hypothetical protein [Planctomycetaceae bacterium]